MIEHYKKQHVVEQLKKYGYEATEDMNYKELIRKLAIVRAMEVKVESPHNSWF